MAVLSEVADLIMGQSPPSSTYNEEGIGLPFFQGKVDFGFQRPTVRKYCTDPKKIAEKGDILISVRAPVGPINICATRSCIGRGLAAIRPFDIEQSFLYYNLRYIEDYIASLGTGSTFKSINKAQLSSVNVNTNGFPKEEQRRIAAVLSAVQRAIEQQDRLIALSTELKKALMHKFFTEGTRGEPQKQTEIGPVPESWEVVELGGLLDLTQYGLSVRAGDAGRYPMLRMTNQINGWIVPTNLKYVELDHGDMSRFRLERGDVLFNRTNSFELVGRTAAFDLSGDYVFASYLIRLRTKKDRLASFFLNHYFNWEETQLRLKGIASRAVSQSNISATRLNGFSFPLPDLKEQFEIVSQLDMVDGKIGIHKGTKTVLHDLFRTLLHQLMTAQIRVNDIDLPELKALGFEVD